MITITLYFENVAHGFETSWRPKSITVRIPTRVEAIEPIKLELRKVDTEDVRRVTVSVHWEKQESRENLRKVADVLEPLSGCQIKR